MANKSDSTAAAGQSGPAEYVLGTGDDELSRLGLQHRLWSDAAHAAWGRCGLGPGMAALDVGCGPGYAAMEMGQIVGGGGGGGGAAGGRGKGTVVGVDESAGFIGWLNAQAPARGLGHVRGVVGDVMSLDTLPELAAVKGRIDLAYARWVLCFLPRPEACVAAVARMLAPGGHMVVHDYFNYGTMTMVPRRRSHDAAVAATMRSWRERGGDPDVAGRVPGMMTAAGLEIVSVTMHQRSARGNASGPPEAMFAWPETWWRTYAPKLVAMGYLTQADAEELVADLDDIRRRGDQWIQVPPVTEIVARKRT